MLCTLPSARAWAPISAYNCHMAASLDSNITGLKAERPVVFASEQLVSQMVTDFGYLFKFPIIRLMVFHT